MCFSYRVDRDTVHYDGSITQEAIEDAITDGKRIQLFTLFHYKELLTTFLNGRQAFSKETSRQFIDRIAQAERNRKQFASCLCVKNRCFILSSKFCPIRT